MWPSGVCPAHVQLRHQEAPDAGKDLSCIIQRAESTEMLWRLHRGIGIRTPGQVPISARLLQKHIPCRVNMHESSHGCECSFRRCPCSGKLRTRQPHHRRNGSKQKPHIIVRLSGMIVHQECLPHMLPDGTTTKMQNPP